MEEFLQNLKETLKDVDGIDLEAIEASANKVKSDFELEKEKINNKNKELLGELKKVKKRAKDAEEKLGEVDLEEYEKLKSDEESRLMSGDAEEGPKVNIEDIKAKIERKYQTIISKKDMEMKTLSERNKQLDEKINSTLIENEVSKYLTSGEKIRDEFKPMLTDYFKSKCFVEDNGDEKEIYIKDSTGDTPINTFFDFWSNSEEAKAYLKAEDTSGAGTIGSKKFTKTKSFSEMTPSEKVALYKSNPAEYERKKNEQ